MMTTVTELADRLRAAYVEGVAAALAAPTEFYAETVETTHVPPGPTDGLKSGAELRKGAASESNVLTDLMPDLVIVGDISIRGNDIVVVSAQLDGTLPDGTRFHQDLGLEYEVNDGEIVRSTAVYDPESIAALRPALAAAFPEMADDESSATP
jgi:ketosteroid isomerase-like protein